MCIIGEARFYCVCDEYHRMGTLLALNAVVVLYKKELAVVYTLVYSLVCTFTCMHIFRA